MHAVKTCVLMATWRKIEYPCSRVCSVLWILHKDCYTDLSVRKINVAKFCYRNELRTNWFRPTVRALKYNIMSYDNVREN